MVDSLPTRIVQPTRRAGLLILLALICAGCNAHHESGDASMETSASPPAPFDPLGAAPAQAELFAPEWIASPVEDRDTALSPDGLLFLFTRMGPRSAILVLQREQDPASPEGSWQDLRVAPFSGLYGDLEPAFTPDGSKLWFASDRPTPAGEEQGHDLWWVPVDTRSGTPVFHAPQRPGAPLNTEGNEFYPSLTRDGAVYFTTTREGGVGAEDIWRSQPMELGAGSGGGRMAGNETGGGRDPAGQTSAAPEWSEPECLGPGVNTAGYEFNAFIAPDESYLLFTRWLPEGDFGAGDLYVSFRREDGSWTEAQNLGAGINTPALDYCPFVSPDGKTLFFSRKRGREKAEHPTGQPLEYEDYMQWTLGPGNGAGDIYWVSAALLDELRRTALAE